MTVRTALWAGGPKKQSLAISQGAGETYQITNTTDVLEVTNTGSAIVCLPTWDAKYVGQEILVKGLTATTTTCTVAVYPSSGDTIDGAGDVVIAVNMGYLRVIFGSVDGIFITAGQLIA